MGGKLLQTMHSKVATSPVPDLVWLCIKNCPEQPRLFNNYMVNTLVGGVGALL